MNRKEWEERIYYTDKKTKKDDRGRAWAFIIYPGDSCPDEWDMVLDMLHIKIAVSPLHNGDEESEGKPHRHVMLLFNGKKSYEQILSISELLNGTRPFEINSPEGYARYLLHIDHPEKQQFEDDHDLHVYGGFDYWGLAELQSDVFRTIKQMQEYCMLNHIRKFSSLANYAADRRMDWFRVLTTRASLYMREYIRSMNNESEQERTKDS